MADYDPYDPSIVPPRADDEDGRVLHTAVAGRAHVFRSAQHTICIMHTGLAAEFLTTGRLGA